MIRRPRTELDGRERWVLISQVEHARLSGEMAANWGGRPFERLEPQGELVGAIYHHDDGWAEWERCPQVDPTSGRPLDFTEMPLAESLAIWRRSIDVTAALGDLAPYMVSGHFSALLRRAAAARSRAEAEWNRLAEEFLDEQRRDQAGWLAAWLAAAPARTEEMARRALAWLQLFDALSLWLCCRERTEPHTIEPPQGPHLAFAPVTGEQIVVDPWPFLVPELALEASGRAIAVAEYADWHHLATTPSDTVVLRWTLRPPSGQAQISAAAT